MQRSCTTKAVNAPGRRQNGFSLMELVLAVGVCVVVLSAVNAVFFGSVRLRETTLQAVGESLPIQQALGVLETDLKGAMAPTTNGIFSGDFRVGSVTSPGLSQNVSIELYTTSGSLRENEPWADVQRVTYQLQPAASGQNLVRSVTRNLLATVTQTPTDQILLSNVSRLDFECFDNTQWRTTWDTTMTDTNLPVAVRVKLELGNRPTDVRDPQPITLVVPLDMQVRTNQMPTASS